MIGIVPHEIDMAALAEAVEDPGAGAIVTFAGTTRNETDGREVLCLTYQCYDRMAESKLAEVVAQAKERFEILRVAVLHRVDTLPVGGISVGIAVSAAHRPAAFEACRFLIDAIKKDVPIWKKEEFADGESAWVHPGECC
jgi:molybdopterin synthase catalytic subunit